MPNCPNPLVSSNRECVSPDDTVIPDFTPTQESSRIQTPLPFTIVLAVGVACLTISRIQYAQTSVWMSLLGISALLAPIANIVYAIVIYPHFVEVVFYLLLGAIAITVLINILHCLFSFATYRRDDLFSTRYAAKHWIANKIVLVLALLTQHFAFALYFCRLFNLPVFKASLETLTVLFCLNYFWAIGMLANLIAIVGSIAAIVNWP